MHMHGGDIYSLAESLGIPERKVVDFSSSINPLGVSRKIKAELRRHMKYLYHYPDNECRRLRRYIARHTGVDEVRIVCGNGSTELIYLTVRALKPEKVLIPVPTFSEYERAVRTNIPDCSIEYLYLDEEESFRLTPDRLSSVLNDHDMVFLCNPNNPTAHSISLEDMERIISLCEERGCTLVIDEAFIDFDPENAVTGLVRDSSSTIVLRSMTKFYALSGLRIGYGIYPAGMIDRIRYYKEPWTVNSLAQRAGVIALKDKHYRRQSHEYLAREKSFLEKELDRLNIKYFPSAVNFYLIRHERASEIVMRLREHAILVRDCSDFVGLDSRFIRIAVRTHRENVLLIKGLKEIIG